MLDARTAGSPIRIRFFASLSERAPMSIQRSDAVETLSLSSALIRCTAFFPISPFTGPEREILMFELPLPPFHHNFGRIQRKLARKHGVALIPKRLFAQVLAAPGSTSDGLHLSEKGATLMADTVKDLIMPALEKPERKEDGT